MLPKDNSNGLGRIREDDELIKRPVVQSLMGGIAVSTLYDDQELMDLRLDLTAKGEHPRAVHWIKREILEVRAKRVARSEQKATERRARQRK